MFNNQVCHLSLLPPLDSHTHSTTHWAPTSVSPASTADVSLRSDITHTPTLKRRATNSRSTSSGVRAATLPLSPKSSSPSLPLCRPCSGAALGLLHQVPPGLLSQLPDAQGRRQAALAPALVPAAHNRGRSGAEAAAAYTVHGCRRCSCNCSDAGATQMTRAHAAAAAPGRSASGRRRLSHLCSSSACGAPRSWE